MEILTGKDSTAELRAQIEYELKSKRQCSYTPYECTQLALDGYRFCHRHILHDKNAPFKQCAYIYSSNGKRCPLSAPRSDKKDYGYCNEHALKATLSRTKQNAKHPPPNTAEVLLCSLSHYIKKPKARSASNTKHFEDGRASPDETAEFKNVKHIDPFVDLDAVNIDNGQCNEVLDFGSESESDIEPSTIASVWQDAHGESSDDESIDSEQEDPLKHANVYTAEEITLITRDKLVRLQSLYVEQYRYLQHLLKEKRRKYLHALKREKETCCNIHNQVRDNPKEQRLYRKLKALNNYHKPHGVDAILNKRVRDIRAKIIDGAASKGPSYTKCSFSEGGVKCGEKAIPLARHCKKHILEDASQVLFQPCGKINGDIECNTPVAAIFDDAHCQLHVEIPPLRSYNQIRKDSESDLDDSGEAHNHYPHFAEHIKNEYIHYEIPPEIPKMEKLPTLLFEESSQSMTGSDSGGQPNESSSFFEGAASLSQHGITCDDVEMSSSSYIETNVQATLNNSEISEFNLSTNGNKVDDHGIEAKEGNETETKEDDSESTVNTPAVDNDQNVEKMELDPTVEQTRNDEGDGSDVKQENMMESEASGQNMKIGSLEDNLQMESVEHTENEENSKAQTNSAVSEELNMINEGLEDVTNEGAEVGKCEEELNQSSDKSDAI